MIRIRLPQCLLLVACALFALGSTKVEAAPRSLPLDEVLASLEKSRTLLEDEDAIGCRAILRELYAKLKREDESFLNSLKRRVQYLRFTLWMRLTGYGLEQLQELIQDVRDAMRQDGKAAG